MKMKRKIRKRIRLNIIQERKLSLQHQSINPPDRAPLDRAPLDRALL
jgi:hypothetical protein